MHISSLWFNTTATDPRVQGISDAIIFVLTDAIVQITGSSRDNTLSDSSMTAAIAQETYVGN